MKSYSEIDKFQHSNLNITFTKKKDNKGLTNSAGFIVDYINKYLPNSSILDYGCGNQLIKKFLEGDFKYYPYDIDVLRNCLHIIPLNKFDVIIANHVFEHMTYEQIDIALKQFKKIGKWVFISTPNINPVSLADFYSQYSHITPLHFKNLQAIIKAYGFNVNEINFSSPYVNPVKIWLCRSSGFYPYTEYTVVGFNE